VPRTIADKLRPALEQLVQRSFPGAALLDATPFHVDEAEQKDAATTKGVGYGSPLRLRIRERDGREQVLVFHTAKRDQFGHDRRADRAAEMLLGFDRFGNIPNHVRALDVGAISKSGMELLSLADAGEFYLLTSFASGHLYADELRRIARAGRLDASDVLHAESLARYLVELHREKYLDATRYVRASRDLVGSGEGIFGIIDAYGRDVPAAPPQRLRAIELRAVEWRWRLAERVDRLSRTHGDFHPFNVVFEGDRHALLDASRGCMGDPADDVTCMAINYVFFAIEHPNAWRGVLGELWHRFWQRYLEESGDRELLTVCAPFLAWRGLVVANPVWYPAVDPVARDRMLGLIERALAAERFDPSFAEDLFT
jgi:hypothetical protein